ncbi:DegQ family serine endoprotease [Hyphococcus flavus]|uniref:DegQ family serine endoprotease n=1 Tax=Hyphococcus flavus TaxID=1866326 RepID=A0AAE9ZDM1_9PROT|nr:DegQ family serine endoprotease [Hyphococcus flavus]WDI31012.1 DegQ family serine endoprotease [Hyphococcus flavus]
MFRFVFAGFGALLFAVNTACAQPAPETQSATETIEPEMAAEQIGSAPRVVPQSLGEVKLSFAPVVERAAPAVVNVYTKRVVQQRSPFAGDPFFERFFGGGDFGAPRERVQNSLGSGVIVSPDGVVVTNNHVIEGMTEIKVVLSDRREYEAELVLADSQTDLAVLRINVDEPLPYLTFANSDSIQVGDVVLAIGNPFGVGQTVTNGIISALARTAVSVSDYSFFIQTDAAINPGNSGGALIDIDGRLVGVNSAIYSRSGGSNGIGFAIPSRLVQQVIKSAISGTALVRPWLGASSSTVTSDMAKALQLARPAGAIVDDVWENGPADNAGIEPGDVIIEVDGQPVFDAQTLQYRIGVNNDGDSTDVKFVRNGRERSATLTLSLPPETPERDPRALEGNHPLNGVTVDNLSPRYSEELGLDPLSKGVVVSEVQSRSFAARRGLRPGHKIVSVNGRAVNTAAELAREIAKPARSWELEIDTGGRIVPWRVGR